MARVKCYYCGEYFDRDEVPFIKVNKTRYAHKNCNIDKAPEKTQDRIVLEAYLENKFGYIPPNIKKQINDYMEQYHFTYTGIKSTLFYYFDILKNKPNLINPSIHFVPYVYPKAKEYYKRLYEANIVNKDKDLNIQDNQKTVTIKIKPPKRKPIKKYDFFKFLDEEEENGK